MFFLKYLNGKSISKYYNTALFIYSRTEQHLDISFERINKGTMEIL